METLKNMTYQDLERFLVVCYYACDHYTASLVLHELQKRPEYYEEED